MYVCNRHATGMVISESKNRWAITQPLPEKKKKERKKRRIRIRSDRIVEDVIIQLTIN